jgi:hypothetical protein
MKKIQDEIRRTPPNFPDKERLQALAEAVRGTPLQQTLLDYADMLDDSVKRYTDGINAMKAVRLADPDPDMRALWRAVFRSLPEFKPSSPKRKEGGGRRPLNNDEQVEKVTGILRANPKLKGERLLRKLRESGIKGKTGTLYAICKQARNFQK